MENVVILGNGPAGCTAAIYAARANLSPLMLTGNLPGGLLTQTGIVENFPGFPDGIAGFELMTAMQQQAENFGCRVEYENVTELILSNGGTQKIILESGTEIETSSLIFATGASPRWLGLPAEERLRNHGVSACATCDGAFYTNMPVAVAGGGDSAMEEANFLTRFASKVYVIHRRDTLRASKIMADRALQNPKIEFIWNSEIVDMLGDPELEALVIKNNQTNVTTTLPVKGFFAALGHLPNTRLVQGQLPLDDKGYLKTQNNSSCTALAGVFAAGDCCDPHYRQAIIAAASGCRAAMDAERYLQSR